MFHPSYGIKIAFVLLEITKQSTYNDSTKTNCLSRAYIPRTVVEEYLRREKISIIILSIRG